MLIDRVVAAYFETNCWIIATGVGQEAIIVDPGIGKPNLVNNIVEKISDTDKTQIQASSIFYFTGRIGRLQYGLSVVIFLLISSLIFVLEMNGSLPKISFWIFFYPAIFILIAQSVKRCHDVGISGWFTLIPIISVFYLLFARGIKNNNNFIGHKEIEEKEDDIEDDIEEESPIKPKDGGGLR